MKCLVKSCRNHSHQGKFIGDVCMPCASYAFAVEFNKEYIGQGHFTKGVMSDIRGQIGEIFSSIENEPELRILQEKYK